MKKFGALVLAIVFIAFAATTVYADLSHPNNYGPPNAGQNTTGQTGQVYLGGDPATSPIHSQYSANTDACASCHAAHTGNGGDLMQWQTYSTLGVSAVCLACHDGTVTSTYNVVNGTVGATNTLSSAGLFAVQKWSGNAANYSASEHGVFSGLACGAAPGGATTSQTGQWNSDQNGEWKADFDCVSCHNPHGQGGNSRILEPNPNWAMTDGLNPQDFAGVTGAQLTTTAGSAKFYFSTAKAVSGTKNATGQTISTLPSVTPIYGYPYSSTMAAYVNGHKIGGVVDPSNPSQYLDSVYKDYRATFGYDIDTTSPQSVVIKPYMALFQADGSAFAPGTSDVVTVDYTPAIEVKMTVANKLSTSETVTYVSGINAFCGTCHFDYDTAKYSDGQGNFQIGHVNADGTWQASVANPKYLPNPNGYGWQLDSNGNPLPPQNTIDPNLPVDDLINTASTLVGYYNLASRHKVGMLIKGSLPAGLTFEGRMVTCLTCHYAHGVDNQRWAVTGDQVGQPAYGSYQNNIFVQETTNGSSKLKRLPNYSTCTLCHDQAQASFSPVH